MAPRLKEKFNSDVKSSLQERFGIKNVNAIPRLTKIVVNMGVHGAVENKSKVDSAARDMGIITGQRPTLRLSRKAITGFKWEFADRLLTVALPRIRDFRGVKTKLDGRGNYTLGLSEQSIFPEIEFDKIDFQQGMDITFVTTAPNDEQGYALLHELGMPFSDQHDD